MINALKMWLTRQRIAFTLRREMAARKNVNTERRHLAKLEKELERLELIYMAKIYLRSNSAKDNVNTACNGGQGA